MTHLLIISAVVIALQEPVTIPTTPELVDSTGHLRTELSEDDLHPNAKGYAIMGPLAEAAIQKALR